MKTKQKKGKLSKMKKREAVQGYLFASPWIIGFFAFTIYPLVSSFYYSFTNYSMGSDYSFIGLDNYIIMFTSDSGFYSSIVNSLVYAVAMTPIGLLMGFTVGLLMNMDVKGITAFRALYYLPCVISAVATAQVWGFMFNKRYGLVNQMLAYFGVEGLNWLEDPVYSKAAMIIMALWGCGGGMMMYIAALKGVPDACYEAARIDGAGPLRRFWKITIPHVAPILFYNLLTSFIGNTQVFASAMLLTGQSSDATNNYYVYNLYTMAIKNHRMGYSCAMGWLLMVVVFTLSILMFKFVGSKIYYEGGKV